MKIVNLTPHEITLVKGSSKEILPSEGLARCSVITEQLGDVNGYPINKNRFGEVTGLPDPQPETMYVVSQIVAQALKGLRDDLLIVDKTVRDDAGRICGCTAFAVV